jgi:L-asparaginase
VIRGFWADSQITQIPVAEVTNDSRPPDQAFAVWLAKTRQKIVDTSFANRLLVVIDEIDLARRFLGTSVISMLRSVDNIVRELQGITVALIGLRPLEDDGDLIDGSGSPSFPTFEVGDFDHIAATHRELARIIGADDQIGELTMSWTNGQPFLTMAFLSRLLDRSQTSLIGDKIVEDVAREIIAAQRNEKSILFLTIERYFTDESEGLNREDALEALQTYGVLLEGKSIPLADRPARILRNTGLCRTSHDNIEIKNRLFREVFEKEWIHKTINTVQKRQSGRRGAHTRFSKNRSLWLINTGGTLGMVRRRNEDDDDEYVDQPQSFAEFSASFPELDDWIEGGEQTFALDSINVTPKHWLHLAERIRVLHQEDPRRSFVVVHGTDTMAYTASALAFAFGQSMDFSIVFTGSQTTPDVPHGDARTNLLRACLAAQENVPEVLIAFGDQLFRAVRARKRDERQFAGFEAVGVPPVGDLSERVEVDWTRVRTQLPLSRAGTVVTGWCGAGRRFASLFADKVLSIQLLPGLEPAFYKSIVESTAETCNGIVIQVLGAGNVTSDEEFGFHGLIGIASRNDIPVLLTSRFQWRRIAAREYRPASEAEKLGAIPGGEMTLEAALVKFRWAIAIANRAGGRRRIDLVREIMETNFVGELDGPLSLLEDDHDDKGD